MRSTKAVVVVLALAFGAGGARGQSLSLALRGGGGIPLGNFASSAVDAASGETLLAGAKSGFGYGLEATFSLGLVGVYAGFDHVQFGCEDAQCGSSSTDYALGGISAGLRLNLVRHGPIRPWAKGGVTFANLSGSYGSGSTGLTSSHAPGYELAGGIDLPVLGFFSLAPQVRYVGQNAKFSIPDVTVTGTQNQQTVSYLKYELGLQFTPPLFHLR